MSKAPWKPPEIDLAEGLVFGFILVTSAIVIGSLLKRFLFG